ncbi:MAG: N-acetylmuramoyl-L-alanine amidase [Proteobacteria bacterium]|nr:N-acetylmuramoyl-L-alanine amidase [Pseudomonadota bacterium]
MKKTKTLVAVHMFLFMGPIFIGGHLMARAVQITNLDQEFLLDSNQLVTPQGEVNTVDPTLKGLNYLDSSKSMNPTAPQSGEKAIRIVVDPGHGGRDAGARGTHGILEKEVCLKVAKFVRREVERFSKISGVPIEVKLSRELDEFVTLRDRARLANMWGADLFVSVHANSSPSARAKGFEVYFLSPEATDEEASKLARLENQAPPTPISAQVMSILSDATTQHHVAESSQFAEYMYSSVSQRISSNARGVRQAPFTVLHGTNMPAVLVEIGYVSNFEEAKNLSRESYLKRIASAISSGVIDFVNRKRK